MNFTKNLKIVNLETYTRKLINMHLVCKSDSDDVAIYISIPTINTLTTKENVANSGYVKVVYGLSGTRDHILSSARRSLAKGFTGKQWISS